MSEIVAARDRVAQILIYHIFFYLYICVIIREFIIFDLFDMSPQDYYTIVSHH